MLCDFNYLQGSVMKHLQIRDFADDFVTGTLKQLRHFEGDFERPCGAFPSYQEYELYCKQLELKRSLERYLELKRELGE